MIAAHELVLGTTGRLFGGRLGRVYLERALATLLVSFRRLRIIGHCGAALVPTTVNGAVATPG